MNQTGYQPDSSRSPSNPQQSPSYSQYQWRQPQQQQAKVVTGTTYDQDAINRSDMEETSRLLSNTFHVAAKGGTMPADLYSSSSSPQQYQPPNRPKHSSVLPDTSKADDAASLSVFQNTALWAPQNWMTTDKRVGNGSEQPYQQQDFNIDNSYDNKRMKFTGWGQGDIIPIPSTSEEQMAPMSIDSPEALSSRAMSYQVADNVAQMFSSPVNLGLSADNASFGATNNVGMPQLASVSNTGMQQASNNQSYASNTLGPALGDTYGTMPEDLMPRTPHNNAQVGNGSNNRANQLQSASPSFSRVYMTEPSTQNSGSPGMAESTYAFNDRNQANYTGVQSYSPSRINAIVPPNQQQSLNSPYEYRYPPQVDLDEENRKRRRESYGNQNIMPAAGGMGDDRGNVDTTGAPKRFRSEIQIANPNATANAQFNTNHRFNSAVDRPESALPLHSSHHDVVTKPSNQWQHSTSPKATRAPNIKLMVKGPKVAQEDFDDFSETHVTETTARQTTSGKPAATEQAINDCAFVTEKAMLDTITVRKCNFIINQIISAGCCLPFVLPVPKFLTLYHNVIKNPSELMTVEKKLWNTGYSSTDEFHSDIAMIWRNAEQFHKHGGDIAEKAQLLKQMYFDTLKRLDSDSDLNWETDSRLIAAEEQHFDDNGLAQLSTDKKTVLYVIRGADIGEKPKVRNYTSMAEIYDILNAQFYDDIKDIKEHEDNPDHEVQELPLPRLFISKNRTMLELAASDSKSVLTVLINVELKKCTEPHKKGLFHVKADAVLVHPLGNRRDLDQLEWPEKIAQAEYAPRAWIKVKILKIVRGFEADITDKMEKEIFKRIYTTTRLAHDPKESILHNSIAKVFVKSVIGVPLEAEDEIDYSDAAKAKAVLPLARKGKPSSLTKQPEMGQPSEQKEALALPKKEETLIGITPTPQEPAESASEFPLSQNDLAKPIEEDTQPIDDTGEEAGAQVDEAGQMEQDQDEEYQDQDYDMEDDGSYTNREEDQPSNDVTSVSLSQSPTPVRQEEAITFMKCIDNENEAVEKDEKQKEDEAMRAVYRERSSAIWEKLVTLCSQNDIDVINVKKYTENVSTFPNAEGYFKQVYYVSNDPTVVVQTFRHMTMYQRITELVCLLKLRNLRHIGQMVEVLKEDEGEVIGLSMTRYQQTLKKYCHVHSHHRLSAHQKYHVIWQMLLSMKAIHEVGLAHRDLSEVNIMVNEVEDEVLEDGTLRPELFLIDFGKAIFCEPEDVRSWWCEVPRLEGDYDGDVVPETRKEMEEWCEALPWVKGKPDHGYKMYRSIQTLPKTRQDSDVLPWLIHPQKEDMYSIGVIIWKTFAETEPWEGVLDTDIKGLRYMVEDDFRIEKSVNKDVPGEYSRKLLFSCLKTSPHERQTAAEILEWFEQPEVKEKLIEEWTIFAPEKRANRRAKSMYGRENSGESEASQNLSRSRGRGRGRAPRGRPPKSSATSSRPRGRPRKNPLPDNAPPPADAPKPRGVGRPRKHQPPISNEHTSSESFQDARDVPAGRDSTGDNPPTKQGPGRPRKTPLASHDSQQGSAEDNSPQSGLQYESVAQNQLQQRSSYMMPLYQGQEQFTSSDQSANMPQGYAGVPAEWLNYFQQWPPQQ
ncbi:hypothetical protein NQZ79_g2819 [Umbelopsis isabellina]|nr:hypothetical protein NQZ79_g2819 [Umbelopsis isabellina]